MSTTTTTHHHPTAEPPHTVRHPSRNAALAEADRWTHAHRAHGCRVVWMAGGRVIAQHPVLPVAATLTVHLD
jgi:hypothetical protein